MGMKVGLRIVYTSQSNRDTREHHYRYPLLRPHTHGALDDSCIWGSHELSLAQAGFFETKHSSQIRKNVVMWRGSPSTTGLG